MKNKTKISFILLSAVMLLSMVGIQLVQAPTPHIPQNLYRAMEDCDNDFYPPNNCRLAWWLNNEMNEDQNLWFLAGWVYTELELEQGVLPQPLRRTSTS
jgi:hypothetical protein